MNDLAAGEVWSCLTSSIPVYSLNLKRFFIFKKSNEIETA